MLTLRIKTTNDAFAEDPNAEIARILRSAADLVERGFSEGVLVDYNGNKVGEFKR